MVAAILFSGHPYIGRHYRATLIDGEAIIYAMRDSILYLAEMQHHNMRPPCQQYAYSSPPHTL